MKRLVLWLAVAVLWVGWGEAANPKYVFLFIGDGMSVPQRRLADAFAEASGQEGLLINRLPHQGATTTRSADALVTDSAASGTAIACGEKTKNGRIGMDASGLTNLESVAVVAQRAGRRVGIVSSVTINHATPASFYGHRKSRSEYYGLGLDLAASGFDFFGGGGVQDADAVKSPLYQGSVYDVARKAGYTVTASKEEVVALKPGGGKVLARTGDGALRYAIDGREGELSLADYVRKGIELLDGPQGFFMMAEGGMIDWMGHANDAASVLRETVAFDEAVRVAWGFAQEHPGEVLIVVTGDHETGGLTLGFAGTGFRTRLELLGAQKCSLPAFEKMLKKEEPASFEAALGLAREWFGLLPVGSAGELALSKAELEKLKLGYEAQFVKKAKGSEKAFAVAVVQVLDAKAGLAWGSGNHTALPVLTTAFGPGAEQFAGVLDNTDVAKRLKELVK